jgi:hypothetical protein
LAFEGAGDVEFQVLQRTTGASRIPRRFTYPERFTPLKAASNQSSVGGRFNVLPAPMISLRKFATVAEIMSALCPVGFS